MRWRRPNADHVLAASAVVISLTLTALTLNAVLRQGETIRERELTDLRSSANSAAFDRAEELQADVDRAWRDAQRQYAAAGRDGLDQWISLQRNWRVAFIGRPGAGRWDCLPRTPAELALPPVSAEIFGRVEELEFRESEMRLALEQYDRLVESDDLNVRVRALLGSAAVQRRLGYLAVAARNFGTAAGLMLSEERLTRYAYGARLASADCLLDQGQYAAAREALVQLLQLMRDDHPARYSGAEVAMVRRRANLLASAGEGAPAGAGGDELRSLLAELSSRATVRDLLAGLRSELPRLFATRRELSADPTLFVTVDLGGNRPTILAMRELEGGAVLALAAPARDLLRRYWGAPSPNSPWRVLLPADAGGQEPIRTLGEMFGNALIIPTPATVEAMATQSVRRTILLISTALGSAAAWGVVIWMMLRAMGRQRELVLLQRRFVADVSHELKTPLALIRLLAETLLGGRIQDAVRSQRYLETITRESERLTVLLDSILDFSRIESGRKKYEFAPCDVGQVARQAWTLFEPQFAADRFVTRLDIEPDLPELRADAPALQQLIVNLLQNAHRYAGEERFVRLGVGRDGEAIVITVEDRGIGMSRSQMKRLGDSFYRVQDARVQRTRGTGLGLAIVKHIVAAHHGALDVQSRPGKGSVFTVRLPLRGAEPPTR